MGAYPAGSYTLTVIWRYIDIFGNFVQQNLGTLPFTVSPTVPPPTPISAPTLGAVGLSLLLLALAGFAASALRSRRFGLLLVALAFLPLGARAQDPQPSQTIELLVSTAAGAPTADQLVNFYSTHQHGSPPLQGLTVGNPLQVTYLLPVRATGDFLARLQANPNSVRAQLERYTVVLYPAGTDLAPALSALQADPYVTSAFEPLQMNFSSVSLTSFSVGGDDPSTINQYARDDLNIDAAWQLAGGYFRHSSSTAKARIRSREQSKKGGSIMSETSDAPGSF